VSSLCIPVPIYPRTEEDPKSSTFMGRTLNVMLKLLDPQICSFNTYLEGWFFHNTQNPVIDGKTIALLRTAIGVQGIIAMETLLCEKISSELDSLYQFYDKSLVTYGVTLEKFRDAIFPEWKLPKQGESFYSTASTKLNKLFPPLNKFITRIGKLQLLRKLLKTELHLTCRIDAEKLLQASNVINSELLYSLKENSGKSIKHDDQTLSILKTTSNLQRALGGGNPMSTLFSKSDALEGLPSLLTLFIVHYMPAVSWDKTFQTLRGKEDESFDGWVVASGVGTLLRQFNPAYTKAFFSLFGQYGKCMVKEYMNDLESGDTLNKARFKKASNSLMFMTQLRRICELDYSVLGDSIPQNFIDMFDQLGDV
jgi:hypothetical protein